MDTDTMQSWLSEQYPSSYLDHLTDYALLLDCASARDASSLTTSLEPIRSLIIPRGYTPLLQPLVVENQQNIQRPFASALPRIMTCTNYGGQH